MVILEAVWWVVEVMAIMWEELAMMLGNVQAITGAKQVEVA